MLVKYPLISMRKSSVPSLTDAVKTQDLQLSVIDAKTKESITTLWLRIQLVDILQFCGAFNAASELQVVVLARQIRSKYFYLTPTELTFFFESFIGGVYGMLYVGKTINPQAIMQAMRVFDGEVINKRAEIENELNDKRMQEEQRLIKEGKTGVHAWAKYCQEHNITDQALPMQDFLKEMRKRKFNVK